MLEEGSLCSKGDTSVAIGVRMEIMLGEEDVAGAWECCQFAEEG